MTRLPPRLFALALLAVAPRAQAPDFAHDLARPVAGVTAAGRPAEDDVAAVAAVTGHPRELLAEVAYYRGTVTRRREEHEAVLLQVPLPEPLAGARIALAVTAKGRVVGLGAWGTPALDEDADLRWALFLATLGSHAGRWALDGETDRAGVMARVGALGEDEGKAVQRLLAQHIVMQGANAALRQYRMLIDRGEKPTFAHYAWLARAAKGLAGGASAFEELLGADAAAAYREHAAELAELFAELAAIPQDTPAGEVGAMVQPLLERDACTKCHDTPGAGGDTLRRTLSARRRGLEVPHGVLQVGYDLAPAIGEGAEASQVVANAFRAGLLLAKKAW